jgi:hypothetical protein
MLIPELHISLDLPVDASDQNSNIRHEQSPAEPIEVPPHLRIRLISGILRGISLLIFHRSSGMAAVVVHEMQDDATANHHVHDLSRNTSDQETTTRIKKSHVAAITRRRNTGNGTSGNLNKNAGEVRADEDVRVPLRFEL